MYMYKYMCSAIQVRLDTPSPCTSQEETVCRIVMYLGAQCYGGGGVGYYGVKISFGPPTLYR